MDSTIKQIIGEADEEQDEQEKRPKKDEKPDVTVPNDDHQKAPEDSEIDELANLWTAGNKGEVIRRYMDMDNETSVKLVFAIGREAALELANMADEEIRQAGPEGEEGGLSGGNFGPEGHYGGEADYIEPEKILPPTSVSDITGR